jgi:hypothetical protein
MSKPMAAKTFTIEPPARSVGVKIRTVLVALRV